MKGKQHVRRDASKIDVDAPELLNRTARERAVSPSHYAHMSPEPIDVIEAWELDFHTASALSYIARAGRKDGESREACLLKAANFLHRAATGRWLRLDEGGG